MIKLKTLKANPKNPRVIKDERFHKLVKSIQEFPKMMELRPMVIDTDRVVVGGNMRLKALEHLGYTEVPDEWVKCADTLTEDEIKRFIIADNVGFGDNDWELLANDWDAQELEDWGLDIPGFDTTDNLGTEFELPSGEKSPFTQMTFTVADEQATVIKNALEDIKQTDDYKYAETFGNENSNGNALYLLISTWSQQR